MQRATGEGARVCTVGTRASRPRSVVCSMQFENAISAETQRLESHWGRCESVYCGDAGVSPAEALQFVVFGSNVNPTVYCGDAGISPAVSSLQCAVCSVQFENAINAATQRLESHGGRCESVHCGDAGVSPAVSSLQCAVCSVQFENAINA